MKPEKRDFRKIPKNGKYLKNIQLGYRKLKPGQNKLFRGLNGPKMNKKKKDKTKMKSKLNKKGTDGRKCCPKRFLIF